ncbi:unnamed protein product, partial [Prorocentrum cordatum]
ELHARLNEAETLPTAPFGRHNPNEQLFIAHAWCSLKMLAALELTDVPFHVLLGTHSTATALQDWLLKALKIPEARRRDANHFAELFNAATEDFFLHAQQRGITATPLSKHTLATCILFRLLLTSQKPPKASILRCGPIPRLVANFKGDCGKRYTPLDACGEDVELAANRLPAHCARLAASAAQPVGSPDLMLPVASHPVMCWICGEGFAHNGASCKHCCDARGGCGEYRKRPLWRAQQDSFKPLLPWLKRHILQSATFHLTFSVPGAFSLHWNHPEAIAVAKARCEVACVACARKDWLDNRYPVHLWRGATEQRTITQLLHTDSGTSTFLTCGDALCFADRDKINGHLSTDGCMERWPLIPKAELLTSSLLRPSDHSMARLLRARRTPLLPDSRQGRPSSAAQPVHQRGQQGSAEQPAARDVGAPMCAGIGDLHQTAHICHVCAVCLCTEEKFIKMPEFALAGDLWPGRGRTALQSAPLGLRMLLGLGRACFRKLLLGKGQKETLLSGFTGNRILISQASATLAEALPPSSTHLKDSFVVIFGQDTDDLRKCQLLTVQREAYKALAAERARVNAIFAEIPVDQAAVNALPPNGVPQQFLDCAVQMPEVERCSATRSGPGTVRDSLGAARPVDDASDELSESDDGEHTATVSGGAVPAGAAQPSAASQNVEHLDQFETPIGMDPKAVPAFMQHAAAFKRNLEHARAARQLNTHNWERNLALLDNAAESDKALFVPSQKPLSTFDPTT